MRLSNEDRRAVETFVHQTRICDLGSPEILPTIASPLAKLLRCQQVTLYRLSSGDGNQVTLDFAQVLGTSRPDARVRHAATSLVASNPGGWGFFNPIRPEPKTQNVVQSFADVGGRERILELPVAKWYGFLGTLDHDHMRTLICDGGTLLAYVGASRPERFGRRERSLLRRLIPSLQQRISFERQLGLSAIKSRAFDALLEDTSAPAFLVSQTGTVAHANQAGRAALKRNRRIAVDLVESRETHPDRTRVLEVEAPGLARHLVIVQRGETERAEPRVAAAARLWRLTPRQAEVLALVVRGESNKAIAASFGCSERTIELHVSAILDKSDCISRSSLFAAVWAL